MLYFDFETMGQNSSLPKGRRKSLRSFTKKTLKRNSLSHTFTLQENDDKIEQLNINIASEEELMTLEGINREIAKSIVEHRKAIGRFRKVEDLALVRGIGANKLQLLRPEICVTRRNNSCASSRAQSFDSLRSTESRVTLKSNKLINVNKASVFEFQTINGITQEIAASIVHYRSKKGDFKKIEDLLKVKGIDRIRFSNIGKYLAVDLVSADDERLQEQKPSILTNGYTMPGNGTSYKSPLSNGLTSSSATDIFELLSAYSPRPIIKEEFRFSRNDEPAIRIASWNLNKFSMEKANNLGVKEVICRTILENGWSIVAVQDVVHVTALRVICDELNKPKLQRVREWRDKSHNWNFCMLDISGSQLGFIYDSDGAVDVELLSLGEGIRNLAPDCETLVGTFRVGELNLQLVNVLLRNNKVRIALDQKLQEMDGEEDLLMVFIDFSSLDDLIEDQTHGIAANFKSVLSPDTDTHFFYHKMQSPSSPNINNILYNSKMQRQLTGYHGLVRHGLTHLAIPNGWNWGGPVSPYCPVWAEATVNHSDGVAL